MIAKELVEILNKSPEMLILVEGYEGGLSDVSSVDTVKVTLNVNPEHYMGRHDDFNGGDISAIILGREVRENNT